jgi:hypothetical protein
MMVPWGPKHVVVRSKIQSEKYWLIEKPFFVVLTDTLPNRKFVTHNRMHTVKTVYKVTA